jgi:3-hydroxyisobutyrate dehydrogenase-like beta-hydroxyacid dehydrogenase
MPDMTVGLLHPGEMGSAVGATLVEEGQTVLWVPEGRSAATRRRAAAAGLTAVADLAEFVDRCDVILSICPPGAALEIARSVRGFAGLFVDANAIAPDTSRQVAAIVGERYVDGSIIGPPPTTDGITRLYLSGPAAPAAAAVFAGARIQARVLTGPDPMAASAIKMMYAAWTKGSSALLISIADAADQLGIAETLQDEWAMSAPELSQRLAGARRSADAKGWRWEAEMREIAQTLGAAGQPRGFHEAAAEVFGRRPRPDDDGDR